MRALWRLILAPLLMAAAVFSTSQQFHAMTVEAAAPSAVAAACPASTHWDNILHRCV
jgi:hypothetical protein